MCWEKEKPRRLRCGEETSYMMCKSKLIQITEKISNKIRLLIINIKGTGKKWHRKDKQGSTLYQECEDGLISASGLR